MVVEVQSVIIDLTRELAIVKSKIATLEKQEETLKGAIDFLKEYEKKLKEGQ